jgi:hypothetical protein
MVRDGFANYNMEEMPIIHPSINEVHHWRHYFMN